MDHAVTPGAWFDTLVKPSWNPPSWVFGPVWTILYIMIAIAAVRLLQDAGWTRGRWAIILFALQLALNLLWPWIFFSRQAIGWAFVDIVLLWAVLGVTIVLCWRVSFGSALLLLPYFAWVSFASVLNGTFWWLNRGGSAGT
ncbi:MAG: tryptophan-rich sensory protein [Phycisphaerae bacterium]|nr:tryptophan-rich sensory protein [Phycisphaerae bacterium]